MGDERTDRLQEGLSFAFGEPIGLLRIACHELVSPLSTIQLCAQSLLEQLNSVPALPPAEISNMVQRIEQLAMRAAQLVDDVLAVDRRPGRGALEKETIGIDEALDDALALHAETLDRAGCSVFVSRGEGLEQARGAWKRQALERLFSNLFQNVARHASRAPVFIHLSVEGDWLSLRFSDRGPGLSATKAGRHGLGLWIIYRTVTELGGQIDLNTVPGAGLTFDIKLPLRPGQRCAGIAASLSR